MRRPSARPTAIALVVSLAALVGCGGDDSGSVSGTEAAPDTAVTVEQFIEGFESETGVELTADDFPGDSTLLQFDDDGEMMEISEAEADFVEQYGNAQIYVVGPSGDVDQIFDAVTGGSLSDAPVETGGDTVRLITDIAEEPDADGVIWVEQCVRYEDQQSLNACSWSGNKLYGKNVIVSWMATGDAMDDTASRLDEAVTAVVAG